MFPRFLFRTSHSESAGVVHARGFLESRTPIDCCKPIQTEIRTPPGWEGERRAHSPYPSHSKDLIGEHLGYVPGEKEDQDSQR